MLVHVHLVSELRSRLDADVRASAFVCTLVYSQLDYRNQSSSDAKRFKFQ